MGALTHIATPFAHTCRTHRLFHDELATFLEPQVFTSMPVADVLRLVDLYGAPQHAHRTHLLL